MNPEPTNSFSKSTGWKNVLKFIIPYVLIVGFLQFITHKLLGISYLDSNTNNLSGFQFLIIELFSSIGTIGLVFVFWRRYVNMPIANIGLSKNNLYYFIFGGGVIGFFVHSCSLFCSVFH
jgi:magnesium-transporting ATPase (P-type)